MGKQVACLQRNFKDLVHFLTNTVLYNLLLASIKNPQVFAKHRSICTSVCLCARSDFVSVLPPQVHMKDVMSAVWVSGLDAAYLREQMMSEPLVREIVKECNNIPLTPPQQGEAMLASFKPRGYSECIVTVGGEERV